MNDKKKQWKEWLRSSRSKGYSEDGIKKELKERGYNEKEISQVLKLEGTDPKKAIYLIILISAIAVGALLLTGFIQKQTTPEITRSSQDILAEVISFQTPKTWSEEEKTQLLEELEISFNEQCSDISSLPSETCFPFVIYSYITTKLKLGTLSEDVNTSLSYKVLNMWEDYYKGVEFNKEGFVIEETITPQNSIIQYYYFMTLMPNEEKDFWFEKISRVSPTDITRRYHLLRIYWYYYNATKVSQIPESVINQETEENLCYNDFSIKEDWNACEVLYYFSIKDFCEIGITDQEKDIVQQKTEVETQDPDLQDCKIGLQNLINTQFS